MGGVGVIRKKMERNDYTPKIRRPNPCPKGIMRSNFPALKYSRAQVSHHGAKITLLNSLGTKKGQRKALLWSWNIEQQNHRDFITNLDLPC